MSINGVFHFMEVCCILPAQHRSSPLCQQRWRFTNLHKSVFNFYSARQMLFMIGFLSLSCLFRQWKHKHTFYWCETTKFIIAASHHRECGPTSGVADNQCLELEEWESLKLMDMELDIIIVVCIPQGPKTVISNVTSRTVFWVATVEEISMATSNVIKCKDIKLSSLNEYHGPRLHSDSYPVSQANFINKAQKTLTKVLTIWIKYI